MRDLAETGGGGAFCPPIGKPERPASANDGAGGGKKRGRGGGGGGPSGGGGGNKGGGNKGKPARPPAAPPPPSEPGGFFGFRWPELRESPTKKTGKPLCPRARAHAVVYLRTAMSPVHQARAAEPLPSLPGHRPRLRRPEPSRPMPDATHSHPKKNWPPLPHKYSNSADRVPTLAASAFLPHIPQPHHHAHVSPDPH